MCNVIEFPRKEWFEGRWSFDNDVANREIIIKDITKAYPSVELLVFYDDDDIVDNKEEHLKISNIRYDKNILLFETMFPSIGRINKYRLNLTENFNLLKGCFSYIEKSSFSLSRSYKLKGRIVNVYIIDDEDFWSEYHVSFNENGIQFVEARDSENNELYNISRTKLCNDKIILNIYVNSEKISKFLIFDLRNKVVKFKFCYYIDIHRIK
ncbi:hypothetical protein WJT86_12055 [Microvirga sp. W0021]|uniref:Uncharacterized protein n=1 Tax=Hohaiivirga grylli TaxID=3133970 RepID=A0ABV0BNF0_9HYPH